MPARPRVTRLVTYRGSAPAAGPVSTAPPPLQTAPGPGGSVQLGPRALAAAAPA